MGAANEREEFSKRLKQKLRERGIEPSSATRLAHGFNDRFPAQAISAQAARKWLAAEAIPGQAKLKALATWLEVGPEWLRFGQEDGAATTARQSLARYRTVLSDQELVRRFRRLRSDQQLALAEIITALSERKTID